MSLLLLLRNRPAPKSMVTKDYDIWDQESIDADVGPQQQKTVEATLQNQLGFLMRKTWRTPTPVGCIMQYVGNNAPIGWLFCDGTSYSQQEYPDLYTIIGTTYNQEEDIAYSFRVPNFAGRVPVGAGNAPDEEITYNLGNEGGETYHTLTEGEMPSHNHSSNATGGITNGSVGLAGANGSSTLTTSDTSAGSGELNLATSFALTINNTGGGQKHNNMQPYVVVRYIIKW